MISSSIRVLLVEDCPQAASFVLSALTEDHGRFAVEQATSLAEARNYMRDGNYEMVLLDLHLPDSVPTHTCRAFLSEATGMPVIVLTGQEQADLALDAMQLGAQDYLLKGDVDAPGLVRAIRFALERHKRLAVYGPNVVMRHLRRPLWDDDTRELLVGEVVVKCFRQPAENQVRILSAFEEDGWPDKIDDPLPPAGEVDPKERLRAAIKGLNGRQRQTLIRFSGDGTGRGVQWKLLAHEAG